MSDKTEKTNITVPDIYADRFSLGLGAYGAVFQWGLTEGDPSELVAGEVTKANTVAIIRTSLLHSKVVALLLLKNIREWEESVGIEIQIPDDIIKQLDIKDLVNNVKED